MQTNGIPSSSTKQNSEAGKAYSRAADSLNSLYGEYVSAVREVEELDKKNRIYKKALEDCLKDSAAFETVTGMGKSIALTVREAFKKAQ